MLQVLKPPGLLLYFKNNSARVVDRVKRHTLFRVELHLLETALDEVNEQFFLCVQGHRQKPPGLLSAVSWTCSDVTQQLLIYMEN